MTNQKSKCCESSYKDRLSIQYPDKTDEELRGRTNYYICDKCGKHCDLINSFENMKLEYEWVKNIEDLRSQISDCEGNHLQQVAYSTYHKGLTQVCFGCKKVRSTIML